MVLSDIAVVLRSCEQRHVLWLCLCCVIIVVEYDTLTTPHSSPECKFSPHQEMGMKWQPVKTNDM